MLVDGVWSAWEDWNCDNGQCERSRACSEPMHEGLDTCGGADTDLEIGTIHDCLLYTSPSPRDKRQSRMPSSA